MNSRKDRQWDFTKCLKNIFVDNIKVLFTKFTRLTSFDCDFFTSRLLLSNIYKPFNIFSLFSNFVPLQLYISVE